MALNERRRRALERSLPDRPGVAHQSIKQLIEKHERKYMYSYAAEMTASFHRSKV